MEKNMTKVNKSLLAMMGGITLSAVTGCSAISTAIHHSSLDVNSKMSNSVALPPVAAEDKTIYVKVTNTSSEPTPGLKDEIIHSLQSEGWTVLTDVDGYKTANDRLMVNILQVGKAENENEVWASLTSGYGSAMAGGLAGVATGFATGSVAYGVGVGAAVGGGSWLADQLYSNEIYSMITDVEISTKVDGKVKQQIQSNVAQGSATTVNQTYTTEGNWVTYKTRIASVAQQANLDLAEGIPPLEKQISGQISQIFAD